MQKPLNTDKAVLMVGFAKMDVIALAVAVGGVCATAFFFATAILLIKGAPEGVHTGTHLGLLGIYLPGYSVSWGGSLLGAIYVGVVGAVVGFIWGVLWNMTHYLYIILVVARSYWWRLMTEYDE